MVGPTDGDESRTNRRGDLRSPDRSGQATRGGRRLPLRRERATQKPPLQGEVSPPLAAVTEGYVPPPAGEDVSAADR